VLTQAADRNTTDDTLLLSSVYSLAVHHQGLWLLSGLESGGINLQSVRHDEGRRITCLREHASAVSALSLAQDEKSVLSGSWDKRINDWDLNTGQVKRRYQNSGSQIAAIEQRPLSTLPIPQDTGPSFVSNGTFSSNNAAKPLPNGINSNGIPSSKSAQPRPEEPSTEDAQGSPEDSLFGDKDSLFGDDKSGGVAPFGDDEDDEFSRAIASGIQQQEDEDAAADADIDMLDAGGPVQPPAPIMTEPAVPPPPPADEFALNGITNTEESDSQTTTLPNGLPHSESFTTSSAPDHPDPAPSSDTTFVDASIDGTLRIWDRRSPNPIARILPSRNTPPWCTNACWSPDGNFIYAGRRNGTVDEYSLHKGLREPRRTFKFPGVSGPVSAVRAMPNAKHLVW
jgi:transcriptional activator SPT8